jgi:ABC-type Fe3+-siderophore transport system permease subunit
MFYVFYFWLVGPGIALFHLPFFGACYRNPRAHPYMLGFFHEIQEVAGFGASGNMVARQKRTIRKNLSVKSFLGIFSRTI